MVKKKIDWLNYGLEFVVVLIGILIAFQLNNWSIKRDQQDLIALHQDAVVKEAKFNLYNLKVSLKYAKINLQDIDTLIQLIKEDGDLKIINEKTFKLLNTSYLYLRDNAYSSLVESGDIRLFKDFDERKRIVGLYEYYVWTSSISEVAYASYQSNIFPYLKKHLDFSERKIQQREVYYDKVFRNGLSSYRGMVSYKVTKLKECIEVVKTFLEEEE